LHPVKRSGSVAHAARDLSAWSAKMETRFYGGGYSCLRAFEEKTIARPISQLLTFPRM
jgi:hypothetical protein